MPVELTADQLFVTVGKRPSTRRTSAWKIPGFSETPNRFHPRQRSNGDESGSHLRRGGLLPTPMLAHKAYREGVVAAETIAGLPTRFQFQAMPFVVFTVPELATVGLTTTEGQADGYSRRRSVSVRGARPGPRLAPDGRLGQATSAMTCPVRFWGSRGRRGGRRARGRGGARHRDGRNGPRPRFDDPSASDVFRTASRSRSALAGEPMHVARRSSILDHRDWGSRDYGDALREMRDLRAARRLVEIPDTLVLVEHPPVITVGVQGLAGDILRGGFPVFNVERGGHSTSPRSTASSWATRSSISPRGAGSPTLSARPRGGGYSIPRRTLRGTGRVDGQRGVWVEGRRKIASVGIAVEEWVAFHGFAVNVSTDLSVFHTLRPCGLRAAS